MPVCAPSLSDCPIDGRESSTRCTDVACASWALTKPCLRCDRKAATYRNRPEAALIGAGLGTGSRLVNDDPGEPLPGRLTPKAREVVRSRDTSYLTPVVWTQNLSTPRSSIRITRTRI